MRKAWAKRQYEAYFINKLTDYDGENSETDSSLDLAKDCGYLSLEERQLLTSLTAEVGKMLGSTINNHDPFLINYKNDRSLITDF